MTGQSTDKGETATPNNLEGAPLPPGAIFVVGFARSGTTLLQALLAAQPGVASFPETHFFQSVAKRFRLVPAAVVAPEALTEILAVVGEKTGLPVTPEEAEQLDAASRRRILTDQRLFEWVVKRFLAGSGWGSGIGQCPSFRWLEKTPSHVYHLERIHRMYPDARFVNVVRHPCPAIVSRRRHFPGERDLPLSTLADRWRRAVNVAGEFSRQHPEKIRTCRYERLAAEPDAVLAELAPWLGLAVDPGWRNRFGAVAGAVAHPWETWKTGVRLPFRDTNAATAASGSLRERLGVQYCLRKEMAALGYKPFSPRLQTCYNALRRWGRGRSVPTRDGGAKGP